MGAKTKKQLVEETEDWVEKNPMAYIALVEASKVISNTGNDTPFKFLAEIIRYNKVFGKAALDEIIDVLDGIEFAKGEYAVPNQIVSGLARRISKELEGYPNFHAVFRKSKFDEPDEVEQPQLF
ncbi:MAG: hypothetical protein IKF78_16210 [Atopobiaceae bacterium]|nr:hypothetical protein [Atopobiaceae bacterium]